MKIKTALFLSLLFLLTGQCLGQVSEDSPCTKVLKTMNTELANFQVIPDPKTLSNFTKNYAAYSGRYVDDFGNYALCQNASLNYYLTLKFTGNVSNTTFSAVVGFCSPNNCSMSDAEANIDLIFKVYKTAGFPIGSITNSSTASFYDPKNPNLGNKATTIIIIVVLCLVALTVIVATIIGGYWEALDEALAKKDSSERLFRESGDPMTDFTAINRDSSIAVPVQRPKRQLKGIFKFLDCFDARKNLEKIVKVKYTPTYDFNLEIFNGIRVFMMLYVVYGHSFLFGTNYIDNLSDIPDITSNWLLLVPNAALYAVDVFFYMSGFLFAYIGLGKLKKMKPNLKNFCGLALHRFLRIWPTYVLAIIFFWRVLPLLGEGPIWFKLTYYTSLCDGTVWQNLLFLDDILVQSADYCFGWGWYLSNDFQMFLITPFLLWLYIRNRKAGKLAMVILMIISYGLALWVGAFLHVKGSPPKAGGVTNQRGFSLYYVKPYIRLPPYLIGVLAALLYKEYKEKIGSSYRIGNKLKSNRIALYIIAFLGLAFLLLLTFLPRQVQFHDDVWPGWFHNTWRAFQKSAYVIAMTMLFLPILLGEDNLLKKFLSHPLLVPLARLSFTAYLVHLCWIYLDYYDATASFHFSYSNVLFNTLANGVAAFTAGLILSLAEVPMANIEATYLSGGGRARANKIKQDDAERAKLNNLGDSTLPLIAKGQ